jgi:hypothetical protein
MNARTAALAAALLLTAGAARAEGSRELVRGMKALGAREASQARARAAGGRVVTLRRLVCAGSGATPADLARDLREAREVYAACGVEVRAEPPETFASDYGAPHPCQLTAGYELKTLPPDQRALFAPYASRDVLRVFYLSFRAGPDGPTTAGTSVPEDLIRLTKDDNAEDLRLVGSLAVFHKARSFMDARFVLPHEMGHVLLDESRHSTAPGNLMQGWGRGHALTPAQCARIRASPFARPAGR